MTVPNPATQMARMAFHCPRGTVKLHEHRGRSRRVPCYHRTAYALPEVLRKMMNNMQNKEAY